MADNQDHAGLEVCPFCGSDDVSVSYCTNVSGEVSGWFVECGDCSACGPIKWPEAEAIEPWNTRVQRQAAPVSRRAFVKALADFREWAAEPMRSAERPDLVEGYNSAITDALGFFEAIQTGTGVEEASDAEVEMLARYMAAAAYDVLHLTKRPTAGEWASQNWRKFAYQAERYLNRTDGPTPTPEDGQ